MMQRRTFLKMMGVGVACSSADFSAWAQKANWEPAYSRELPITPFDAPEGTWSLAVLPDTQNYCGKFSAVYLRQTEWIAAHRQSHQILFVAHEGDIVDKNVPEQWEVARRAMSVLNRAALPYCLLPGNHDYETEGGKPVNRSTLLNKYFSEADYAKSEAVGYFETGKMDNSWHELTTPWGKVLVLALECGPRNTVLEWANQVVAARPECKVIVDTHAYLFSDGTRLDLEGRGALQTSNPKTYPYAKDGDVNDGEDIWKKFASKHENILFVLCGHVLKSGVGHLVSEGAGGRKVHQVLANYQASVQVDDGTGWETAQPENPRPRRAFGGGGFVRLMRFLPDRKTVQIKTYSPWYDRWLHASNQEFSVSVS